MGLSSGSVSHLCMHQSFKATYSSRGCTSPPPHPSSLRTKRQKSMTHNMLLFMVSENSSFHPFFFPSFLWLFPTITNPASFHMYSRLPARGLALIQLLLQLLSLKCTTPQLFPSTGRYLHWLQLQKQKRKKKSSEKKPKSKNVALTRKQKTLETRRHQSANHHTRSINCRI